MKKLGQRISQIAKIDRTQINWAAINLLKETTHIPDLRHLAFEFNSTEFVIDEDNFARAIVSMYDETKWIGVSKPPATARMP